MSTRTPQPLRPGANPVGSRIPARPPAPPLLAHILTILLLAVALAAPFPGAAGTGEPAPGAPPPASGQLSLDFEESVRLAIRQSPYFTKSAIEIDLRRLDETDSRYGLAPSINFHTLYYVNHPSRADINPKPYSLSFATDPYNPFGAYFTLQAQKLATQMAILVHLEAISQGLQRLGVMFLELDYLKRVAACQANVVDLCRENLTFGENRLAIGTGTSLEIQVAAQELQLAQNEQQQIAFTQKKVLANLRTFLGLKPDQEIAVDLKDLPRQVLGTFDAATVSLAQAKSRSYELKVLELKKQLQGYNITLAKTRMLPRLVANVQNPDPLSLTNVSGLYAGIGVEVPIWDGFKRLRDVSRQKTVLRQMNADKDLKEAELEDKWLSGQQDWLAGAGALKIARSQEELAHLKERQSEIRYHSGGEPLPVWLEGRKGVWQAKKSAALKSLDSAKAALALRQLSGDLGYTYVDANSWQK